VQGTGRFRPLIELPFWFAVVSAAVFFLVPAFIIRPFKYQSPRALALAIELKQRAPLATLFLAAGALAIAVAIWHGSSRVKRFLVIVGLVLAGGSAVMSRLNYFEWMFHPIVSPGFLTASNAQLDAGEMVMAIHFGNDARAYPIVQMAYHHVFNDEVGATPIVVTY
jgi:hypothetical protein